MGQDRASSHPEMVALRDRIARIERGEKGNKALAEDSPTQPVLRFGIEAVDGHFPEGGLVQGGLHEIAIPSPADVAAATGFSLALIKRALTACKGMALWCVQDTMIDAGALYPPGLVQAGISPDRLVVVRARRDDEVLWVMEEALRSNGPVVVCGEILHPDLTASRRLQLAAGASSIPALILRPEWQGATNSAAATRWRLRTLPSQPQGLVAQLNEPGNPRWQAGLFRCRGGGPGIWEMEWQDETGDLALAAPAGDGPGKPRNAGLAG